MTDAEIVEVLATKGMGWHEVNGCWANEGESASVLADCWNPLTDLNAVAEVEARLTSAQWDEYLRFILESFPDRASFNECYDPEFVMIRHTPARTCCEALVRVLK